jgi:putative DNA primase/helicase
VNCPADAREAALHFLSAWFAGCEGLAELRWITPEGARQEFFALTHLENMADRAVDLSHQRAEVYFGCATRVKVRSRPRGRNADVLHLPGLWCDLDFERFDAGGIDALEFLEAFRPRPTQIVHSGGGLHVYWKFAEPLLPTDRRRAMLRALARTLRADPGATDFARILRIPGTWSWKREVPVRLLECRCSWTRASLTSR